MENIKELNYKTKGVCSKNIHITVEDRFIRDIKIESGCEGNLAGISILLKGMDIDEVITRLSGIRCGSKGTSCPDQIARALTQLKEQ